MVTAIATTGQCGRGWRGLRGRCVRAKAANTAKAGIHAGEHLAENVAAWKVGKVVGGAISAAAAAHGHDSQAIRILSETAIQATTATLLSLRHKADRTPEKVATKFVAEAAAAFAGKLAHSGFESASESLNQSEQFASIGALISGKSAGITTNMTAMRSGLAQNAAKKILRLDSDGLSDYLGLSGEELLMLTIAGYVLARNERRIDAWKSIGANQKGQSCGRGWVGLKGACKRAGGDKAKAMKQSKKDLADKIRAKRGLSTIERDESKPKPFDRKKRQTQATAANTMSVRERREMLRRKFDPNSSGSRAERLSKKEEQRAIVGLGGAKVAKAEALEKLPTPKPANISQLFPRKSTKSDRGLFTGRSIS